MREEKVTAEKKMIFCNTVCTIFGLASIVVNEQITESFDLRIQSPI